MIGQIIDTLRYTWKLPPPLKDGFFYLDTDYGKIRIFDTKGNLPVIITVPDGPNVIEHQTPLIKDLAKDYRVISFEYPGLGFSFPNNKYDYSFSHGAALLLQVMNSLKLTRVSLLFSCSNGYYAIEAANKNPEIFNHIFLSQTPSIESIVKWTEKSIPGILKIPVVGQFTNALLAKRLSETWYKYSLPKNHKSMPAFTEIANSSITEGGCFCLSSLVQGLNKDKGAELKLSEVPATLVWGSMDFTHRKTEKNSIKKHIEHCEVIEFETCGHFPELESRKEYVQLIKERTRRFK